MKKAFIYTSYNNTSSAKKKALITDKKAITDTLTSLLWHDNEGIMG
ncbi:MAG: hypothetical protein ACJATD_000236 [Alloalcanivorax sp.]|jgi:hypothetical protein